MASSPPRPSVPTVPASVLTSNAVVVGGGPCGSMATLLLQQRGIPVTLVEKNPDFSNFNISRSYAMAISYRGRRAMKQVPGLTDRVAEEGVKIMRTNVAILDYANKKISFAFPPTVDGEPNLRFLRPGLLQGFKSFVMDQSAESTTVMYGTCVKSIKYAENGKIQLLLVNADGNEQTLQTHLVLACDGRHSFVVNELNRAEKEGAHAHIHNSKGFGTQSRNSPSVGLAVKSVTLNQEIVDRLLDPDPENPTEDNKPKDVRVFRSKNTSRGISYHLVLFSVGQKYTDIAGGIVGTIVTYPDHAIWKLSDVEDAYSFFEESFPLLDVRKLISKDSLNQFISSRPGTLPPGAHRDSLVHHVGGPVSGGVVILGDAAHSFPPDLGLGMSAAFEDLEVLMRVFDEGRPDEQIDSLLTKYEERRAGETAALVRVCILGAPYQYGQSKPGLVMAQANAVLRQKLSQAFPGVFFPCVAAMVSENHSFTEILRRADLTTFRLQVALGSLVVAPLFVMLVARLKA